MDKKNNWCTKESEVKNTQIILFGIIIMIVYFCFCIGCFFVFAFGENQRMEKYDLYQCIYNNAKLNGGSQKPEVIKKIQEKGICFRENNYKNLLEADCSYHKQKLFVTQACEQGCVWSHGLEYNDSYVGHSESNDLIFPCIFRCNDKFFYGVDLSMNQDILILFYEKNDIFNEI